MKFEIMGLRLGSFLFAWLLISYPGYAQFGFPNTPTSPIDPSESDCRRLEQEFNRIVMGLHEEDRQCMSQEPRIGYGASCSGGQIMRAWPQCSPIDLKLCDVSAKRTHEVRSCYNMARERSRKEKEERSRQLSEEQDLKNANNAYEKARSIITILQNPKTYLRRNLSPYPKLLNSIFGNDNKNFDQGLAQELYRYAHNQAIAGTGATLNPIIREIQYGALQHLANIHKNMLSELSRISEDLKNFTAEFDGNRAAPAARAPAKPVRDPDVVCAAYSGLEYMTCVDEVIRGAR